MSTTPRNQIRLQAITGSIADISVAANQLSPASAEIISAENLHDIMKQTAGAIKRIHGANSFTEAQAGVFTHATASFSGQLDVAGTLDAGSLKGSDLSQYGVVVVGADGQLTTTASLVYSDNRLTVSSSIRVSGDMSVDGEGGVADITSTASAAAIFDVGVNNIYIGGDAEVIQIGESGGLVDFAGDVRMTGSLEMMGAGAEFIDRLNGGSLTIRGGALTGSVGKVSMTLSGSDLRFDDGYRGGWDNDLKLASSENDWTRFKNIFGEASILQAISNAAALPTDAKFMYKVASEVSSPAVIGGGVLQQVNGTHFSGSYSAVPAGSRNENVDVFLNGQLLVSKSYDAVNYDYDIAGDGSSITFNFALQPDDFISVLVPVTVASVVDYVAANGTGGGGGGGGASALNDLTDVTITSPSNGQVLKYNGSAWVNDTDAGGASATEGVTVVASALTGVTNIDTATNQVHYYTTSASANWTPNIRSSSSVSLNTAMAIGDAMTVTIMATIGSSGFYAGGLQIDGASVTPKWAAGIAPTSGNTNGIDVYSYTIVKTASATFTVIASVSQFA
jgi:hypothetical protein